MPENTNHTVIAAVRNLLRDVDPAPFTRAALDKVHLRVETFIDDLLLESIRVAKRQQDDRVTPKHVEFASDIVYLRRKRKLYSLLGAVGGIFVGAALAMAVELSTAKPSWTSREAFVVLVLATVGGISMTIQLLRE